MLKNWLTIAWRNLRKHKGYSVINLLGLAIGLAVCLLIFLYIRDELGFDLFHEKSGRIYRLVETRSPTEGGEQRFAISAAPVGPAMVAEFPEVVDSTRLIRMGRVALRTGVENFYEEFLLAEPSLFTLFDFEFLRGRRDTALAEPNTIVLTETLARKYFGAEDPLGWILKTDRGLDLRITGVLRDPPPNSHLRFDSLISFSSWFALENWRPYLEDWATIGFITYVLLDERADVAAVQARMPEFLSRHRTEEPGRRTRVDLQPLADVQFGSGGLESDRNAGKGRIGYVRVFAAIAGLILLIACINYVNISTARAMTRAGEIGMRKIAGATSGQLVGQFLGESVLQVFLAFILGLALARGALPAFNALTGKATSLTEVLGSGMGPVLAAAVLLVGLAAGAYPAFYLSKVRTVGMLKGRSNFGTAGPFLRRSLVVVQFALSSVMIVATLTVIKQLDYVRTKSLGFDQDHLIVVDINSGSIRQNYREIKHEFLRDPRVSRVSATSRVPGEWKDLVDLEVLPEGGAEADAVRAVFFGVDGDFLDTFEVELVQGRNFMEAMATDASAVLLNEAAVRALGWTEPVGRIIRAPAENFEARVIGVVKDFHFRSLHEEIGPLVLGHSHNPIQPIDYITARISGTDISATLAHLESVHAKYDTVIPFEHHFLDQQIETFYATDRRVGRLFGAAAGLAVFLACLGLFGLAAFTAGRRTKEVGVRKVLGATVPQIVGLLSMEFAKLVLAGLLVAAVPAFVFSRKWLLEFAYRTGLGVTTFALAGALLLILALATVSGQAVKAALADPADSLRYE